MAAMSMGSFSVVGAVVEVGESTFVDFFRWVFSWRWRLNLVRNPFEQIVQVNGFFGVWTKRSTEKRLLWANTDLMVSMDNLMRLQLPLILESHATLWTLFPDFSLGSGNVRTILKNLSLVWFYTLMSRTIMIEEASFGSKPHSTRPTIVPLALLPAIHDNYKFE